MVVVHHCLAYYNSITETTGKVVELAIVFMHTSHVPLFCIVAGYLCHKQPLHQYYKKKFLRVLLPFFTFSILKLLYSTFISPDFSHGGNTILSQLVFAFFIGTQYWFAYAIFNQFCLAPLFWDRGGWKLSRGLIALITSYTLVVIITVLKISMLEWFQLKETINYLPYFTFGIFLVQNKQMLSKLSNHRKLITALSSTIVLIFLYIYNGYPQIRIHPIRFFVALATIYLLYRVVEILPNNLIILSVISKYSLQIMFFDAFYRIALFSIARRMLSINVMTAVLISIPTILLGIISCLTIQKIPYVKALFGL